MDGFMLSVPPPRYVDLDDLLDDDIKEAWEYATRDGRIGFMTVQSLRNQKRIIELLERMS